MPRFTHFALVALAPLALAAGCSSETPPPPPLLAPGGGGGSAPSTWGELCGPCALDEQCATAESACAADVQCAAFLDCLGDCPLAEAGGPDASCVDACPTPTDTSAATARRDLETCIGDATVALNCPDGCTLEVTMKGHPCYRQTCTDPPDESNECATCEDTNCCETFDAYFASDEARALVMCYQACPLDDDTCWVACDEMHPDGIPLVGARFDCLTYHCSAECAGTPPAPCVECADTNCEVESGNLQCNGDYWAFSNCLSACNDDPACEMGCLAQHPSLDGPTAAYLACLDSSCSSVCGT